MRKCTHQFIRQPRAKRGLAPEEVVPNSYIYLAQTHTWARTKRATHSVLGPWVCGLVLVLAKACVLVLWPRQSSAKGFCYRIQTSRRLHFRSVFGPSGAAVPLCFAVLRALGPRFGACPGLSSCPVVPAKDSAPDAFVPEPKLDGVGGTGR